jgi:hypothetical protein
MTSRETVSYDWTYYKTVEGREESRQSSWPTIPVNSLGADKAMAEDFGYTELPDEFAQPICGVLGDLKSGEQGLIRTTSAGLVLWKLVTVLRHKSIEQDKYCDRGQYTDEYFV